MLIRKAISLVIEFLKVWFFMFFTFLIFKFLCNLLIYNLIDLRRIAILEITARSPGAERSLLAHRQNLP